MAAKKASAKAKITAAVAEVDEAAEPKVIEWEGLTFELPAKLPEAVFIDWALVQSGDDPSSTFEMLGTMIGTDQLKQVRNKLKHDDSVSLKEVAELIGQVFEAYGTSEGESEASQDS